MRPGVIIGVLGLILIVITVVAAFALFAGGKRPPEDNNAGDGGQSNVTPGTGGTGVRVEFSDEVDRIVLNAAEGGIVSPMEIIEDKSASGGRCVMTPHDPENEHRGGRVEFVVDVESAGRYNLWLRVFWSHSCANSLWVELDGERRGEVTNNSYGHWQWIRLGETLDLQAGKVALAIESREDESKLDQILLTQDISFVPVGVQSAD